jgi:DnaJ-class molecular chaperone
MAYPINTETADDWTAFSNHLRSFIVPPKGRTICEECGGSGSIGAEQRYTDPTYDGSETQWRGYLPTNFCNVCNGTGVWPPLEGGAK